MPTTLDGVEVEVVWLRHGWQGGALVAWLPTALCAPALAEMVRVGLLQAVATRGLAAGAAGVPQAVLKGVNPGLEGAQEGRQRTHQGLYGFFAPQGGGMDIFWGREPLWCHAVYCARVFSIVHQGMLNFLVCLSSNKKNTSREKNDLWSPLSRE